MPRRSIDDLARLLGERPSSRRAMLLAAVTSVFGTSHSNALASSRKRKDKDCPFLKMRCGNKCVNGLSDRRNCGYCGLKCSSDERCSIGHCEALCVQETCESRNWTCDSITSCGKTLNCGNCPPGLSCRSGQCVVVPPPRPLNPGERCLESSQCVQTFGYATCSDNYFSDDGSRNCCLGSGGKCSSSRHCCGYGICFDGVCDNF